MREIAGHLRDLYGIDVLPTLILTVTDAVLNDVAASLQRPLNPAYPLVIFCVIRVKIRDEGMVSSMPSACADDGRTHLQPAAMSMIYHANAC